jgi:hypothetical protein
MSFLSAAAPFAAYRRGEVDEALALAERVTAVDPNAAEAHMCAALIQLRRNDAAATIESLKRCARSRSADWILAQLRSDFAARGAPAVTIAFGARLGGFFRSQMTSLGARLAPEHRRADHAMVNVVGTSYVRSFGGSTALFPLFIGMGPTMLLLTEEASALTRRKFAVNLERVDPRRDTLLVVGGDAFYHVRNILKTRPEESETATPADYELMALVARRHGAILADARKLIGGRLFMLGSTPTFSALVDDLALRLNEELAPVCAEHDVELVDCWAELADPATNRLRVDYSANAYPGDIHYSLATTPIFINALKARGALPPETPADPAFEWSSVFECDIDPAERTRIWCEPSVSPNNAFKSDKIATSHLLARTADLVVFLAAYAAERTLAIVNVQDGYAAVAVPSQAISGCVAITDSLANRQAAQMTLDFFGRSDVDLHEFGEAALDLVAGSSFWAALLIVHPDSVEADEARCNAVLGRIGPVATLMIATARPDRIAQIETGSRAIKATIPLSNRHIPAKWHDFTLFMMT